MNPITDDTSTLAPDISVSIVSYNTRDLLRACLRSLFAREAEGEAALEVIVADNGSTDGTLAMLQQEYPHVRVVETGGNIGYGRANNAGLAGAQGRYFLIVNSDTEIEPGALRAMRAFFDSQPNAGMAGPRLILPDGKTQPSCFEPPRLFSVFSEQFFFNKLFPRSRLFGGFEMTYWDYSERRRVAELCGACFLVRRSLFREIGGFDSHYFMYFEDIDLCVRLRRTGAEIWFLPEAQIRHHLGASSGKDWRLRARMIVAYNKSRYYFFSRNGGKFQGFLLKSIVVLGAALRLALSLPFAAKSRERVLIFRQVLRETRRMQPGGDHDDAL